MRFSWSAAAAAGASLGLIAVLFWLTLRWSLFVLLPGSVVWGGCVRPVNPAHYAVLVSW